MKIDYVIPFVDDTDPVWQEVWHKHTDDILDSGRWRDWDILRYQLRSIETNMPWVNRIFLVLSVGESQIPKWLNTESPKVKVVYDYEIAPNKVLPTFNSNVVELFFPRIPELSEHYLTACDDYLINAPLLQDRFFTIDGKIRLKVEKTTFEASVYGSSVINSTGMVYPRLIRQTRKGYRCLWANHTVTPHIKSENLRFLEQNEKRIIESCTPFREHNNLTWLIYPLNMMRMGRVAPSDINVRVVRLKEDEEILKLSLDGGDVTVLNDWYSGMSYEDAREILGEKMEERFPERCKLERSVLIEN